MTALVDVRLTFAYLAEQPIIHTEETLGNISKIKKMRVMFGAQPIPVPALSGNSFRGQLRDILADRMFEVLTDTGQRRITFDNNEIYGAVYCGGALREGSRLAGTMQSLKDSIPLIRLMGAAFGNVMLPSKLAVTHVIPCAQETRDVLATALGEVGNGILPCEENWPRSRDLVFNDGPLTRKDDRRDPARQRFADPGSVTGAEAEQRQQMIYYVECIPAGTWLLHQLYTKYPLDELELGCLFDGLGSWLNAPALGGRSAAGYGQVRAYVRGKVDGETIRKPEEHEWPNVVERAMSGYLAHLKKEHEKLLVALQAKAEGAQDGDAKGDA
jgi:hypothetical protein